MSDATLLLKVKAQEKSGWIAALLNLVFPGGGYFYCHRPGLGIFALCLCVYAYFNFGAVGLSLWVLFFIDGFLCAGRYNKELINKVLEESAIENSPPNALQVVEVARDGYGHSIGIKIGDALLSINGNPLPTTDILTSLLSNSESSPVNLKLFRDGEVISVSLSSSSLGLQVTPVIYDGTTVHKVSSSKLANTTSGANSGSTPRNINLDPTTDKKLRSNNAAKIVLFVLSAAVLVGLTVRHFGIDSFERFFDATLLNSNAKDLESLRVRQDISTYTVDGELAEAFNINSKSTDIQRENLLKEIKGKLIIWEVNIYEIKKNLDSTYTIQTSGGLNIGKSDVGTFITLSAADDAQSKFIEGLKTGDVIRVKGILSGESLLRSLVVKPAMLWYPDEAKTQETPAATAEGVPIGKFEKDQKVDEKLLGKVSQFLSDSFGTQDAKLKCHKINLTQGEGGEGQHYCIRVARMDQTNNLTYMVLAGDKYDENWNSQDSHVDQGIIRFIVLKDDSGSQKIHLSTKFEDSGNYGTASSSAQLVKINPAGDVAWVTSYGDVHQGYSSTGITLTAVIENQIKVIASIPTSTDNSGACGDEETCEFYTAEADLRILNRSSEGVFPLRIEVDGRKGTKNKMVAFKKAFDIIYSKKDGEFILPKELTDIFAGSQ